MKASFFDLMKFAKAGITSPPMTAYDKKKALSMFNAGIPVKTLTGVPPLSFKANGKPLISLSMPGNGQQQGTPTPDAPIMPDFCGKLVGSDWVTPITCAGQTVPIYLGQVSTVRRIKKLVLNGSESWFVNEAVSTEDTVYLYTMDIAQNTYVPEYSICSHFEYKNAFTIRDDNGFHLLSGYGGLRFRIMRTIAGTVADFKSYLAQQYAAGTPVTVWYVLTEPEATIVNEPLAKIGDYAGMQRLRLSLEGTSPGREGKHPLCGPGGLSLPRLRARGQRLLLFRGGAAYHRGGNDSDRERAEHADG